MCGFCVWPTHTGVCRYVYALQRPRRISDILLYHSYLCSLETGTPIETGSHWTRLACKSQWSLLLPHLQGQDLNLGLHACPAVLLPIMPSPQTKHLNILTNSIINAILKSRLGPAQDLTSKAFQGNINCTPVTKPSGTRLAMLSYQLPAQDKRKFYTCKISDQRHALLRSEKPCAILTCFPLFRPITVKRTEQIFFSTRKIIRDNWLHVFCSYK